MKQCNNFSLPSIFRLQNRYHFIKPLVSRLYCFLPKNVSTFLDMFIQNLPQIYLPLVILYEHGRRGARIAAFMWIYNFGDCLPRLRNNNTFHVNREKHDGFYRFQCLFSPCFFSYLIYTKLLCQHEENCSKLYLGNRFQTYYRIIIIKEVILHVLACFP